MLNERTTGVSFVSDSLSLSSSLFAIAVTSRAQCGGTQPHHSGVPGDGALGSLRSAVEFGRVGEIASDTDPRDQIGMRVIIIVTVL
jgi:hypothetical protein